MESSATDREQAERERQRKKRERLDRFVVRLRIIEAHSLAADRQRLATFCEHRWEFVLREGPDASMTIKPIPLLPTEQVESAIARIRPLLVEGDGISYKQVLGALGEGIPGAARQELALRRAEFETFDPEAKSGKPKKAHEPGAPVTNSRIGSSWLYGDLVHADPTRQSYTAGSTPEFVFVEAQRMTCGLMLAALHTLDFFRMLHEQGLIYISDESFTRRVTTQATEWAPEINGLYSAPLGAAMPGAPDEPLGEEWTRHI